jgi:large subunit ribosomal protein L7Ae
MADEQSDKAYGVVEVARSTGKIRKGANEATKAVERGIAKAVVYAKDVQPQEIIMHLPLLCKERNILCLAVASKEELGHAAGIGKPTAAVAIVEEGEARKTLEEMRK